MIYPKKKFSGSTDFTGAIFKIPQISKHFSAMLFESFRPNVNCQLTFDYVNIFHCIYLIPLP